MAEVFHAWSRLVTQPDPVLPQEAVLLTCYNCHIPTGHVFREEHLFTDHYAFETCLLRWNQQGADTWEYTEHPSTAEKEE